MKQFKELLKKKNTLYVVSILSILQILYYISNNNISSIIFFILVGLLAHHFSDNMIIVLLSGIIASILYNNLSYWIKEGFEKKKRNVEINPVDAIENDPDETDTSLLNSLETNEISKSEPFSGKKKNNYRIDYASTLESAYSNLDKILGKDGIQNLTNDTQKLMKNQKELFDSMKGMMPVLNNAKEMLKGFDLGKLSKMASQFSQKN
uniref:Uncharacterized protein n=1 Tax=viral metagenome TaxID=1070528 RepID=A0A6C0H6L4_9ZZZZ